MSDDHGALLLLDEFGRRTRAARILAGCDSVRDGVALIEQRVGVRITPRAMYSIERGEVCPSTEQFLAIIWTYRPPGLTGFFATAFRPDILADSLATLEQQLVALRQVEHDRLG